MKIYIASSWKNEHLVVLITERLRKDGHEIASFVESGYKSERHFQRLKQTDLKAWFDSMDGGRCFQFDTLGALNSDLVLYLGPSGKDAAAEVGIAWGNKTPVLGLWAKGEDFGLMRRLVEVWFYNVNELLLYIKASETVLRAWKKERRFPGDGWKGRGKA